MMRRTGAVVVGLCLGASPAAAQEIRTGASPSVVVQYEDNLLRSNATRGGPRDGDIRVTPTLDLNVSRAIGRQSFYVRGTAGYDFHDRYKGLNRERILIDAGANLRIGGFCRLGLKATIDYSQTDIGDLGVQVGNATRRRVYLADAACPRSAGLSLRGTASRTAISNSSGLRSAFDLRAFDVAPAVVYSRPSLGDIVLDARYAQIVHPDRTMLAGGLKDRTRILEVGIRLERKVAARLGGVLGVAYASTRTQSRLTRSYSGPTWLGRIFYTPTPLWSATVTVERRIQGETNVGAAFYISTLLSLEVRRQLGERTVVDASIARENRSFRGEQSLPGLPTRGSDTSTTGRAGIRYRLTRRIDLSAYVAHRGRDARNPFFNFQSTTVGMKAGINF